MQPWQTQSLITLLITAVVVVRFVRRELGARVVRMRTLWIRPAILLVLLGIMIFLTIQVSERADGLLALALIGGAVAGAVTGWLVVRSTTFSSVGVAGAVRVHGSPVTATVWVGAVLLRLVARLLIPHSDKGAELALNAGLIALVEVAFVIVAIAFHRAILQYGGAAPAPGGEPVT